MGVSFFAKAALLAASAVSTATAAAAPSKANYTEHLSESFLSKGVTFSRNYAYAVLYTGVELAYNKTSNPVYFNYIKTQIDGILNDDGSFVVPITTTLSLDDIRIGLNFLWLWSVTGETKYKIAADNLRHQLDYTPRNPDGGFWHRRPTYPDQMWLDGIYMASNFYTQYTAWFQPANTTAWDDIILQYDLIEEHTRVPETGLLFHGYDASGVAVWADPVTGAAPHIWDRAVGWYFMSLVEMLDYFPKSHPGYARNVKRFQSLAAAVKKSQDPSSGGWWLIMDPPYPSDPRNYIESSGSAMFTYGLLRGIRKGFLKEKDYGKVARRGYETLKREFISTNVNGTLNWEGTVQVGSLGSNGTFEYYISVPLAQNDYKGAGPFIYASYELEGY
ncbi:Putative Unsaturated rhamnogalacturonan hydrolase (Eurofung) [Aspergillus calidoustus]|uniref:Putative Unsaturated rhamnogalacturonan hydrolase (Eurofung) n=1 Tax=Aspergillus calidoustus TaxID=454130 RepID=A0A0U5GKV3_ASPCI|nr:Putative Unsaturated rhamnogalacturonan hydrolase (Eurofung) [Aspergillus calidoustus]